MNIRRLAVFIVAVLRRFNRVGILRFHAAKNNFIMLLRARAMEREARSAPFFSKASTFNSQSKHFKPEHEMPWIRLCYESFERLEEFLLRKLHEATDTTRWTNSNRSCQLEERFKELERTLVTSEL